MNQLYRVITPYFVCGFEVKSNVVVKAAPIIHYIKGWTIKKTLNYFNNRGYEVEPCNLSRYF